MKKTCIVVDNYKLPFFHKRLTAEGYEHETAAFTPDTSGITLFVEKSDIEKMGRICKELELQIKRLN